MLQLGGIALVIVAFLLSTEKGGKQLNWKWFISALLGLLFSGCVGIIQKIFVKEYVGVSLDLFLSASFGFMVLLSGLAFCFLYFNEKGKIDQ